MPLGIPFSRVDAALRDPSRPARTPRRFAAPENNNGPVSIAAGDHRRDGLGAELRRCSNPLPTPMCGPVDIEARNACDGSSCCRPRHSGLAWQHSPERDASGYWAPASLNGVATLTAQGRLRPSGLGPVHRSISRPRNLPVSGSGDPRACCEGVPGQVPRPDEDGLECPDRIAGGHACVKIAARRLRTCPCHASGLER